MTRRFAGREDGRVVLAFPSRSAELSRQEVREFVGIAFCSKVSRKQALHQDRPAHPGSRMKSAGDSARLVFQKVEFSKLSELGAWETNHVHHKHEIQVPIQVLKQPSLRRQCSQREGINLMLNVLRSIRLFSLKERLHVYHQQYPGQTKPRRYPKASNLANMLVIEDFTYWQSSSGGSIPKPTNLKGKQYQAGKSKHWEA